MNMYSPDYSVVSGLVADLDSDGLKEILNDDEKLEELFQQITQVKDWENAKEEIMERNRSLAEQNLLKEPELSEKKERLQELADEGKQLCTNIQEMLDEIKEKSGSVSLDTALALLQTAAATSEEESESVAEQFVSSEIDTDAFLEQFATLRKVMHMRKVKADKMKELITKRSNNTNDTYVNSVNTPAYPVGPINMPMPSFRNNYF